MQHKKGSSKYRGCLSSIVRDNLLLGMSGEGQMGQSFKKKKKDVGNFFAASRFQKIN